MDWNWHGFDLNTTVTYLDGFHEILFFDIETGEIFEHWVNQTWFFDVQASYEFTFAAPVENHPVAGYSTDAKESAAGKNVAESNKPQTATYGLPCWKSLLNNSRITIGCNDVLGTDPPEVLTPSNSGITYPTFIYDGVGRFVYVSLTKKF